MVRKYREPNGYNERSRHGRKWSTTIIDDHTLRITAMRIGHYTARQIKNEPLWGCDSRLILEPYVVPFASYIGSIFHLMHNNADPHIAKIVQNYLNNIGIRLLE